MEVRGRRLKSRRSSLGSVFTILIPAKTSLASVVSTLKTHPHHHSTCLGDVSMGKDGPQDGSQDGSQDCADRAWTDPRFFKISQDFAKTDIVAPANTLLLIMFGYFISQIKTLSIQVTVI